MQSRNVPFTCHRRTQFVAGIEHSGEKMGCDSRGDRAAQTSVDGGGSRGRLSKVARGLKNWRGRHSYPKWENSNEATRGRAKPIEVRLRGRVKPIEFQLQNHMKINKDEGGVLLCSIQNFGDSQSLKYNDDEDDDFEGSSVDFSSNCFDGDAFPVREKLNDPIKVHLGNAVRRHFSALVLQLLKDENFKSSCETGIESWLEIISSLAWQAARFVKPHTRNGETWIPVIM
ncbi:1-phosphatidylinositol-3-phosphate 5-kinase FAB1B [Platanthera guangdongensis]|uniref:1-phosphatidylinositol-3-phosphate 5-kinase FAB1B n=1 Tax=Platanthera guangdongensis TaxID=2320717 RepID=A0ABR2M1P9_9ASPA